MIQAVRDKVLAALMDHFSGEQLSMIDKAVADALHGYRVEKGGPYEDSLALSEGGSSDFKMEGNYED